MTNVEQPSVTFRPAAFLAGKPGSRAGHLPFIYDLVTALRPPLIVELGVYFGDTYFGLCQAVAENNISSSCYGVDTWTGDEETGAYDNSVFSAVSRYNEKRYRSFSYLVRKRFHDALSHFSDQSIGLLHIDGLHSYDTAKTDFESWISKVTPGGVILLSEVAQRGSGYGTWKFWEELQKQYSTFIFRNNGGLGVLRKLGGEELPAFLKDLLTASEAEQERIRRYYVLCAERLDFSEKAGAGGSADAGNSVLQVHLPHAGQYKPAGDLRMVMEPGTWTNVSMRLAGSLGDGPLRIDVASRSAVIEIASLTLRKLDGQTAWEWTPKDPMAGLELQGTAAFLPSAEFLRILSYGNEPKLFVTALTKEALELEMRLRVDPELGAVRELAQLWAADQQETGRLKIELAQAKTSADLEADDIRALCASQLSSFRDEHQAKIKEISEDAERRLAAMRDDFEKSQMQQAVAFEEERKQHQSVLAEREHLLSVHPRLSQEAAIARGNVEELQAEIERLNTLQAQLEYDITDLRKLNSRMAAALEQERHARSNMEGSSSWQLTKPLRAVTDIFGPRKR